MVATTICCLHSCDIALVNGIVANNLPALITYTLLHRPTSIADIKFISMKFLWGVLHGRPHNQIVVASGPHGIGVYAISNFSKKNKKCAVNFFKNVFYIYHLWPAIFEPCSPVKTLNITLVYAEC